MLRPDEEDYVESSERCSACGHLDCFHDGESEACCIGDCLCSGGRIPTSDEVAQMWWLELPGNEAYLSRYETARAQIDAELDARSI